MDIENLRSYLTWLITPQNDNEQDKFRQENLVDDYIELKNKIPDMSFQDLIAEINIQLAPYGKSIDLLA